MAVCVCTATVSSSLPGASPTKVGFSQSGDSERWWVTDQTALGPAHGDDTGANVQVEDGWGTHSKVAASCSSAAGQQRSE